MSPLIQGAIRLIEAHDSVEAVAVVEAPAGVVEVRAQFRVDLPSRCKAAGVSLNGVRSLEEVLFEFAADFPSTAPRITLREDFPDTLPHTYLHKKGARVPPCITFGDKRDVMHSDGIYRLADQMSDWLDKAATDSLAANEYGWEPSRRHVGVNFLDLNPEDFVDRPPFGGWRMFLCSSVWAKSGTMSMAFGGERVSPVGQRQFFDDLLNRLKVSEHTFAGRVPLVFLWPQVSEAGKPAVNAHYKADSVTTFAELAEQASEWRCRVALNDFVSNFNRNWVRPGAQGDLIAYLVFPIRRPKNIIGTATEFEMMAYRMPLSFATKLSTADITPVTPVAISTPISSELLSRTSALKKPPAGLTLTFLGCGSLGSKALMHVVRAGASIGLLIDEKNMVSHNVARHTLLPEDAGLLRGKAERLADIVRSFATKRPKAFLGDVRGLDFSHPKYRDFFNGEHCVIVNTTGSTSVRSFLSTQPFPARVIESALLNHGAAAFMTVEGPGRNPSTLDLIHHAYERLRPAGVLQKQGEEKENVLEIGVGCHSVTIPMPDSRVSLVAAGVGQKLLQLQETGLPDAGVSAVSLVGEDGMSISWTHDSVGPTHLARVHDDETWSVRVLDAAHQKILADVALYPHVESGGLIVGRVSSLTREIFITDVLPAPQDSTRSATRFVLGTEGTVATIREYEALGGQTLSCLGTWHSHLAVSGPSQMDRDTAKLLDGKLRNAAVLLIRHPAGYAALVRDGAPA
ncbi:Mov34/MPN/PAD-1 family protein [Paraburkholderia sp. RL18-101-BIB-B]|uniref:Mov34/MPN/PAD-1 family protein n=1 Tax=Paraburkholderia sp. RL18-101-BIB-B TaxID=3031634 RepID=UPI0038BCD854